MLIVPIMLYYCYQIIENIILKSIYCRLEYQSGDTFSVQC